MNIRLTKPKQSKLREWYTKPREGALFRFSEWILTSNKSFGIIFAMGHVVACSLFLVLFILSLIYWGLIWEIILGAILLLSLRNLYKLYKTRSVTEGMNLNEFIYKK